MRGEVMDLTVIASVLIIAALGIFLSYIFLDEFYSAPIISDNEMITDQWETQQVSLSILANSFVIIFICFGVAAAASAFFTETHPIFFIFSIFSLGVCVVILSIFSDVFVELASSGVLLPVASEFVLMVDTIANFQTLGLVMGAVIVLALFAKKSDLSGGGGQP